MSSQEAPNPSDAALGGVFRVWQQADPNNKRLAQVFRQTFDQVYDGQRTGRFKWEQLNKTEKTHFGTLFELNLRREFRGFIADGHLMDFRIDDSEVDCKYSQRLGGWMIPPEAHGHVLLVASADDEQGTFSLGLVRATSEHLNEGTNRDAKKTLNASGRDAILWIAASASLPPNVLATLPPAVAERIFAQRSGQARVNELLRSVLNRRISRTVIATVAMQADYMKRVRSNGGARTHLAKEGLLIPGGDYNSHRQVAKDLGASIPERGEVVSLAVVEAEPDDPQTTKLDGRAWRLAREGERRAAMAPSLPSQTARASADLAFPENVAIPPTGSTATDHAPTDMPQ